MDDELTTLLAAGERAAFHGRPVAGIAPLQQAVERAGASGRGAEATAAAWLLGVALGAAGRYGSALAVLTPLTELGADAPDQQLFSTLAASTAASVHRQLGQHESARELDELALKTAGDSTEAQFDARLGLASDAIGLGDAATATTDMEAAASLTEGRPDWWRQRVRLLWIKAELAMLAGNTGAAVKACETATTLAETSGAPRHVAKSLLFMAVAQVQGGEPDEAVTTLRRAATLAESLGTLPLLWPSRALLGALLEERSPAESAKALASARNSVLQIADDLPEELRADWLDRPDVATLLGAA